MIDWQRLRDGLGGPPGQGGGMPAGARLGAALVLLREAEGGLELLLTRRRDDLPTHGGQIAFPGGRVDPGETVEAAAVREADEEVGLDPGSVELLGRLAGFYIPPSGFWLVPVVARWRAPHRLVPAEAEVAAILPVPLTHLSNPATWRATDLPDRGRLWAWQLDDRHLLWGATAVAVAEMLDAVRPGWRRELEVGDLPTSAIAVPSGIGEAGLTTTAGEQAS